MSSGKLGNLDYFNAEIERHFIGDLLNDDEGFGSWESDDLKSASDSARDSILSDVKNTRSYSSVSTSESSSPPLPTTTAKSSVWSSRAALNFTSNSTSAGLNAGAASNVPLNDRVFGSKPKQRLAQNLTFSQVARKNTGSSPNLLASRTSTPPAQARNPALKQTASKSKHPTSLSPVSARSPNRVIGFNPVKTNNKKDLVARDAKLPPRKKEPKRQISKASSELTVDVKFASFKNKPSPTGRSCSNESPIGTTTSKFQVLKELCDDYPSPGAFKIGREGTKRRLYHEETSSQVSGSSNDFDIDGASVANSQTLKRNDRTTRASHTSSSTAKAGFFYILLATSFMNTFTNKDKSKPRRGKSNKSRETSGIVLTHLAATLWDYARKGVLWLLYLIWDFFYLLFLATIIMIRSLFKKLVEKIW